MATIIFGLLLLCIFTESSKEATYLKGIGYKIMQSESLGAFVQSRFTKLCITYRYVILGNVHGHHMLPVLDVYGPKRVYIFRIFLRYVSTLLWRLGVARASSAGGACSYISALFLY